MTGQLNTSLISDSAVEEEIDCLDSRVTAVESDVATNKTNIATVADSLSSYKSSQSDKVTTTNVKATTVDASTVKSTAVNATCVTATQATINTICNTTLNGNTINAQSISAPNVASETVSATNVVADSITVDELKSTGDVVGSVGTFTTVDATNVIAGNVKADSISGTVTGNVATPNLTATTANIKNLTVDCNTTVNDLTANGDIVASGNIKSATINADCGTISSLQSTNACFSNITVCNKLTLCDGVIDATFGDATADSLTADNITVNGDAAITGKVTVGAVTSSGAVTGSEYCNGTKGIVIDKDSNITAAAITADSVTADTINATDGTSNLDQVCITTATTCNEFVTNFYPTNITIDKDVGDLHYSRQLDTDNAGNVLVDCKNVYGGMYCDKEGYCCTTDNLNQYKRLGGICLDSNSNGSTYTTDICLLTTECKGYSINGGDKLAVKYTDGDSSNTLLEVDSNGVALPCVPYCSDAQSCVLALDSNNNIVSQQIKTSLIDCDCVYDSWCSSSSSYGCCYTCICQPVASCTYTTECKCICDDCTFSYIGTTHLDYSNILGSLSFCRVYPTCYESMTLGSRKTLEWDQCAYSCVRCICKCACYTNEKYNRYYPHNNSTLDTRCCVNCILCSDGTVCQYTTYSTVCNALCPSNWQNPSTFCRQSYINNAGNITYNYDTSWCLCLDRCNVYLKEPYTGTDILRVEDGKIYTKCGEFTSGSSFSPVECCDVYVCSCWDRTLCGDVFCCSSKRGYYTCCVSEMSTMWFTDCYRYYEEGGSDISFTTCRQLVTMSTDCLPVTNSIVHLLGQIKNCFGVGGITFSYFCKTDSDLVFFDSCFCPTRLTGCTGCCVAYIA